MKDTGIPFEKVIHAIYSSLYESHPGAKIEHNVLLQSHYGSRQFDVVITINAGDFDIVIPIECKNYSNAVSVDKIDAFDSKLRDVRANKGIMIARSGFQEGAIIKAKDLGILLYTVDDALKVKDIDLTLDCVIHVITPIDTQIEAAWDKKTIPPGVFFREPFIINGYEVKNLIEKNWRSNTLQYVLKEGEQEVHVPELRSPYHLNAINAFKTILQVPLTSFKIKTIFEVKNYKCQLKDLKGAKGMKGIGVESMNIFINHTIVKDSIENLTEIDLETAKNMKCYKYMLRRSSLKLEGGEITFGKNT